MVAVIYEKGIATSEEDFNPYLRKLHSATGYRLSCPRTMGTIIELVLAAGGAVGQLAPSPRVITFGGGPDEIHCCEPAPPGPMRACPHRFDFWPAERDRFEPEPPCDFTKEVFEDAEGVPP